MFYIVTYVTHEERYFKILKNYPGLVVLGMGTTWKGFKDKIDGTVEFCKTKNPDDIILFVDGFDSVILCDSELILSLYNSKYINKLVFSKSMKPKNIIYKYTQDKFFGRCNGISLNSGMYIGRASSIIDFWSKMTSTSEDDQRYANYQCTQKDYVVVDTSHELFYNYSTVDALDYVNNKLSIKGVQPCVISAPVSNNINGVLSKIGFTDLPDIGNNTQYKFRTYFVQFIPEILFVIVAILILKFNKTKINSWIIIFLLFLELIHYQLYVKFHDVPLKNKLLYSAMDLFHIGIMLWVFTLLLNFKCNTQKLILLNLAFLVILLLFFIFKRCFLTTLENGVINVKDDGAVPAETRLSYFFDINKPYLPAKGDNTQNWMNGNTLLVVLIIVLNAYCLFGKRLTGKCNSTHTRHNS